MANNIQYAQNFLRENLRKGYSIESLTILLKKKRIDQSIIKKAVDSISKEDYEQEAVIYLTDLLRRNMEKGVKTSTIMSMLEDKGIDHALIRKALDTLKGTKPKITKQLDLKTFKPVLIIIAGIIIVAGLWLLVTSLMPDSIAKECGTDKNCFYDLANNCNQATVNEKIGTSNLQYTSLKDCTIIKQFTDFGIEEPEAVTRFFRGKQMVCKYKKNSLKKAMTQNLVGAIESCTGLLKDAVYELEYARLQLES